MSKSNNIGQRNRIETFMGRAGNVLAWSVLIVVFCVLPLYFKSGYELISSRKYILLMNAGKILAIVGGVFYLFKIAVITKQRRKKTKPGQKEQKQFSTSFLSDTAFFMVVFVLLAAISHFASDFRTGGEYYYTDWFFEGSLWGTKGWYMGLMSYVIFAMFAFLLAKNLKYSEYALIPIFAVAFIESLWGVLNRYNIDPVGMNYNYVDEATFLASIGNINWFAGYSSIVFPLIWGLYFTTERKWLKLTLFPVCIVSFYMVLVNGSNSGLFSMAVTFLVLLGLALKSRKGIIRFLELLATLLIPASLIGIIKLIPGTRALISEGGRLERFYGVPAVIALLVVYFFIMILSDYKFRERTQNGIHGATGDALVMKESAKGKGENTEKGEKKPGITMVQRVYLISVASLVGLYILLLVLNTLTHGTLPNIGKLIGDSALFTFNNDWGSGRGATWSLGMKTFLHGDFIDKLIGSGPDTMYYQMISFSDLHEEWYSIYKGARLTNAHNEWITLLVNNGILGLLAFVFMLASSVKASFKAAKEKPELIIFSLAIISYTAHNMFSFQQITNTPLLFAVIGIEAAALSTLTKSSVGNTIQKG